MEIETPTSVPEASSVYETISSSPWRTKRKKANSTKDSSQEEMDVPTATTLKRLRDSREGTSKKLCRDSNSQPTFQLASSQVNSKLTQQNFTPIKPPPPQKKTFHNNLNPTISLYSAADYTLLSPSFLSLKRLSAPYQKTGVLKKKLGWHWARTASLDNQNQVITKVSKELKGVTLCLMGATESKLDFQLWKALKILLYLQKIGNSFVINPCNFLGSPTVTTFFCSSGSCMHGMWRWLEMVSTANVIISLEELERPSLKKINVFFFEWGPSLCAPIPLQIPKAAVPTGCRKIIWDGWVTTEFGTSSLAHAVGILTPEELKTTVDTEKEVK